MTMAVAVKNSPETTPQPLFDRLAVSSLVGAVYVLGSIGIVFYLIPSLLGQMEASFVNVALRLLAMVVAAGVLIFLGTRLVGPHPAHGLRAGIFVALVALLVVGLITWGAGMLIEGFLSGIVGIILTALIGAGLLVLVGRWFFNPSLERALIQFEDQGWFTAAAYKPSQGQRVRRGTIVGILFLALAGVWTLWSHDTLASYKNWELPIPFTQVTVLSHGDTALTDNQVVDKTEFNQRNAELKDSVKISNPGGDTSDLASDAEKPKFHKGEIVSRDAFREESERLDKLNTKKPTDAKPVPATGKVPALVLLPDVRYTLPLLLALASLWLAYRVVNYPVFADFLIATEAEMNKVSWTTRKRLVQDTIVVLVTVILMTLFLFVVDIIWFQVLSWPPIGVIQKGQDKTGEVDKGVEKVSY
jgi:preprotein translocase SecE subunit